MANKNYIKGRRLEYLVMDELRSEYLVVMRTAGSHGMFDVIAIDSDTLFVQVKTGASEAAKAAIEIMAAGFDPSNRYEVWHREKGKWHKTIIS